MQTIREAITEAIGSADGVITKKPRRCVECNDEFVTWHIQANGKEFFRDTCTYCWEKSLLIPCKRCGGYKENIYAKKQDLDSFFVALENHCGRNCRDEIWHKPVTAAIIQAYICPVCHPQENSSFQQMHVNAMRTAAWREATPPEFREMDVAKLPRPDIWRDIEKHDFLHPTKHSLFLYGTTGTGKTRMAYQVARRAAMMGLHTEVFTAVALSNEVSKLAKTDMELLGNLEKRLCRCDVLMIDDFGKGSLSERNLSFIFSVLDHRTAFRKPVIITTNESLDSLTSRIGHAEVLQPLFRRLRDTSWLAVLK